MLLSILTSISISTGNEKPGVVTKMNLTLSADHRVFDGKVGGMLDIIHQYEL